MAGDGSAAKGVSGNGHFLLPRWSPGGTARAPAAGLGRDLLPRRQVSRQIESHRVARQRPGPSGRGSAKWRPRQLRRSARAAERRGDDRELLGTAAVPDREAAFNSRGLRRGLKMPWLTTVRPRRFGRRSPSQETGVSSGCSEMHGSAAAGGEASHQAWVSAILATCWGLRKPAGGCGGRSSSKVGGGPRIRQAFVVSRQPSLDRCAPRSDPGSRVRTGPP
jgi:hypothetical protein